MRNRVEGDEERDEQLRERFRVSKTSVGSDVQKWVFWSISGFRGERKTNFYLK